MRLSVSSLAVIRRTGPDGLVCYLTQWNAGWDAFNFVGGHKHDDESHRACLVRELAEELGLYPAAADPDSAAAPPGNGAPHCRVAAEPLGRLEYESFSRSA